MYFHNSLIPRGAYFILPLESKQEATTGWNFTKCISEVKVNQLKVKNMHVKMGISTFKIALNGRGCASAHYMVHCPTAMNIYKDHGFNSTQQWMWIPYTLISIYCYAMCCLYFRDDFTTNWHPGLKPGCPRPGNVMESGFVFQAWNNHGMC